MNKIVVLLALAGAAGPVCGAVIGSATVTNAQHYGYFAFASTSAQNTKATVPAMSGVARMIRINGTVTRVHADAWLSSIQVQASGGNLAGYQPWIQFSKQNSFTGTVPVSTTVYIPGGLNMSAGMNLEMFSLDSEQFVPGIDARSTLTFEFDDALPAGTVEYSGALTTSDPKFNRPVQYGSSGTLPPELTGAFPYYDVQPFHVGAAGSYRMMSANEFESASVLYAGNFDPANSLANVVAARNQDGNILRDNTLNSLPFGDDAVGGTAITANLVPGVQYYFVTTAFNAPGIETDGGPFLGRYRNMITGAGAVALGVVPEPGVGAAMLGVAGMALRRRQRAALR
jgi:hypothetical protein